MKTTVKTLSLILITIGIFAIIIQPLSAAEINQTEEPQELYTEDAYGIFYTILIIILLAITILTVIIALPRIKKYT